MKIEIIAELCQNHNGDRKLLEEMVYAAAESGATYAKIQSMLVRELTDRERFNEGVIKDGVTQVIKRPFAPEYERLRKLDLFDDDHHRFIEICKKAGIRPMTTVFTRQRVPFVASLGLDTVKVASFDCSSFPMIEQLKQAKIPRLIVSTGVTYDHEIERTAKILANTNFALLHCVSIYPTPLQEAHLNRLKYLRTLAPVVGISDHSNPERDGVKLSVLAVSLGASIIEKHFTILPKDQSRDGPVSANPAQLRELATLCKMSEADLHAFVERHIPEAPQMMGNERRTLSHTEVLNRDYYRGRFASKNKVGDWVYNWEEREL